VAGTYLHGRVQTATFPPPPGAERVCACEPDG